MKFRAEGNVYDFAALEEAYHDQLLKNWHRDGPGRNGQGVAIECLCHGENHAPSPLLYVKRVKGLLYLGNYPSNTKKEILHMALMNQAYNKTDPL